MVFSTPVFVFYFLPAVLLVYYLAPVKARNAVLFAASLLFYFWGEQLYTLIMLLSTVIDYIHGLLVDRCKGKGNQRGAKLAVVSSIVCNLGILFFFKYWDFFAISLERIGIGFLPVLGISLPIGISFFTFQTMSYTIDVYRGDARAQKNIISFGTFVTMFPQLIAGPIIKYKDVDRQLESRSENLDKFASGAQCFVTGLAKKLLLANNVGQLWEYFKGADPAQLSTGGAWLGILAFSFQIYFDFSGYSDMAVGLGRMLGFEFMKNFDYPYISKSITEFWRRWHISLSSWFREYLYIPLGGSRCSRGRWMLNLLAVWAATGIWHGANWNYLLWGLYFFVLLLAEKLAVGKLLERSPAFVGHIYTLLLVMTGWAVFALEDFSQLSSYLGVMFGLGGCGIWDSTAGYYLLSFLPVLIAAAVASTPVIPSLVRRLPEGTARLCTGAAFAGGLIICTAYLVDGTYNPFLYFRF